VRKRAGPKAVIAEVVDNLRRVFQVVHGHSKRAERESGLTGPQLWAIKVLAESTPIRVSELARRMYLHPSTVVGILDRLVARGLVARERSREDRRVVSVALTPVGREMVARAPVVAQGLLLSGLEALPPRDLKAIAEGLRLLVDILGAQELPPQLLFSREVNRPGTPGGISDGTRRRTDTALRRAEPGLPRGRGVP
jgi:MarR family transcriptional regulator, organic hydroperoxide resistance regulator